MPTRPLRIATWTADTYTSDQTMSNAFTGKDISYRLQMLESAVTQANTWFDQQWKNSGDFLDTSLNVFVGPEYLFARAPNAHSMELREMLAVEAKAKALSKGILLIPGTVSWKKQMNRQKDDFGAFDVDKGFTRLAKRNVPQKTRWEKAYERLDKDHAVQMQIYQNDVGRRTEATLAYKKKKEALFFDEFLSPDTAWVNRNTAFVYHDGTRLLKYHKRGDFSEVLAADASGGQTVVFVPGDADGFFTIPGLGLDCGIEVCLDHAMGYLTNTARGRTPHLHFISSAWVEHEPAKAVVKPNGYIVHASSDSARTGVFNHQFNAVNHAHQESATTGTLRYYTVSIDV